jgi:N-sulfoglucosamine sulfohydrolase
LENKLMSIFHRAKGQSMLRSIVWSFAVCLATAVSASGAETSRPNILFCFADDWGHYASAYAKLAPGGIDDVVQTPNFDRLAKEGVLFNHAYVNAPSCTPCRSSLLSGQHFWRTGRGAILQGAIWNPEIPVFPLLLRDSGYAIGKMYKVWSPGAPADAPFGEQQHAYQKAGGRFNQFSQNATALVAKGKSVEEAKQELYAEVQANFDAFLADRKPGQPFCFWFGPTNVHRKWTKGSGKALWNIDPDRLQGKMPPFLPDVPEVREDLADYFGEVQAFDAAVGLLLKKLEDAGELDKTLVVVSGDHGAPGFAHGKCNLYDFGTGVSLAIRGPGVQGGRVVDDFVSLVDLAPTFLEVGGVARPEVMTGKSLVPVLQSRKSGLVDPERKQVFTGRERHVESARDGFLPYPQRAIRTAEFLYIINFEPDRWPLGNPYDLDGDKVPSHEEVTEDTRVTLKDEDAGPTKAWLVAHRNDPEWKRYYDLAYAKRPREELYDLKIDPHQVKNVAANVAYAGVKQQLEERLLEELTKTGDPRVTGDRQFFEKPPMAGPLAESAGPKNRKKKQ